MIETLTINKNIHLFEICIAFHLGNQKKGELDTKVEDFKVSEGVGIAGTYIDKKTVNKTVNVKQTIALTPS